MGNIRRNPFNYFCISPIRILLYLWIIHKTDETDRNYAFCSLLLLMLVIQSIEKIKKFKSCSFPYKKSDFDFTDL